MGKAVVIDEHTRECLAIGKAVRARGLRICRPDVLFVVEEAVVVYDYALGTLGRRMWATKLRIIPAEWFRS